MADKFGKQNLFTGFNTNNRMFEDEGDDEEDNETDYDALNSETFGDNTVTDWEEEHEMYASEHFKDPENDANQALSMQVALNVLDTSEDSIISTPGEGVISCQPTVSNINQKSKHTTRNVQFWDQDLGQCASSAEQFPQKSSTARPVQPISTAGPFEIQNARCPPPPVKMLSVQDIERQLFNDRVQEMALDFREAASSLPRSSRNTYMVRNEQECTLNGQGNIHGSFGGRFPRHQYNRFDVNPRGGFPQSYGPRPRLPYTQNFGRMPVHGHPQFRPQMVQPHVHRYPGPGQMYQGQRFPSPQQQRHNWFVGGNYGGQHMPPPQNRPHAPMHPTQMYFQPNHNVPQQLPARCNDEFAGLMTQQDKAWLAKIQMTTLNQAGPSQDYYNTEFQKKHGNGLHKRPLNVSGRESAYTRPAAAANYTPQQFENALGRLQIGSVTAPRRIIDMDVAEGLGSNQNSSVDRKTKKVLLDIEKLYDDLMKIVDEGKSGMDNSNRQKLIEELEKKLLQGCTLHAILCINKGKTLVLRCLRIMTNPGRLTRRVLKELASLQPKNMDRLLLSFLPSFREHFKDLCLEHLTDIVLYYRTPSLLSSKMMVSILANILQVASLLLEKNQPKNILEPWKVFLNKLLNSTAGVTAESIEEIKPVVAISRVCLKKHFDLLQPSEHKTAKTVLVNLLTR